MAKVNQFAPCSPTHSAGRGPIAARADVEFSCLWGLPQTDAALVQALPQSLEARSQLFDDSTLSA
jgi:hypothetical protein